LQVTNAALHAYLNLDLALDGGQLEWSIIGFEFKFEFEPDFYSTCNFSLEEDLQKTAAFSFLASRRGCVSA